MFNTLEDIYDKYNYNKKNINQYKYIEGQILELFNNNIIINVNNDDNINLWIGHYYQFKMKNYPMMKKYYLMVIELGDDDAMYNLGLYYETIEKDYQMMKKYYLMAIEKGNSYAMINLKNCYKNNILKLYTILEKSVNKENIYIQQLISEYKKHKNVIKYLNKIKIFKNLNNYKKCNVCLEENVLNITFDCGHKICSKCYIELNSKCYFNFCSNK